MDDFYRILGTSVSEEETSLPWPFIKKRSFTVELNPSHRLYNGHFQGNPIVPGVCQVQIIKELVSLILQQRIVISKSDNIKFLSVIIPSQTTVLEVVIEIRETEPFYWKVSAVISREQQEFIKFNGVFQKAETMDCIQENESL